MSRRLSSHDVPRPLDTANQCVVRIERGDNHAVVDLLHALEREEDPRYDGLMALMERAMTQVVEMPRDDRYATNVVSIWHHLAVSCVRVMQDPDLQRRVDEIKARLFLRRLAR